MTAVAYAGLWLFVFSIPWERVFVLPGISIITQVTGALSAGLALLAVVLTGRFRRWHVFHLAALLFWVWAALDLFLWHTVQKLPNKFWTFGQLLVVVWIIWELATTERRILGLLTAYVLGGYVAVLDTVMLYRREGGALRRFAAGGADPNDLAMILALGIPMAWYLGMTYRRPVVRWICRGYLPAAMVAVGLTGSRGGMLATTVALMVIPLTMTRLSPNRLALAIISLVLSGALAVAYTPETLLQRLATTGEEVQGGSLGGRGKLWKAGLEVFAERPLVGYGTGGFVAAITPIMADESKVAHNSFLSVLVEEGLVGLIIYLAMILAVVRAVLRLPKTDRRFALAQLATLGVAMLPLTWEDRKAVWFILPVMLGFAQVRMAQVASRVRVWGLPRQPTPIGPRAGRQLQDAPE